MLQLKDRAKALWAVTCDDIFRIKDTDHVSTITIRGLLAGKDSTQLPWPFKVFSDAEKERKSHLVGALVQGNMD